MTSALPGWPAADLLPLLILPLAFAVWRALRRPNLQAPSLFLLATATVGTTWLLVCAWWTLRPQHSDAGDAFSSAGYMQRDVPMPWLLDAVIYRHGWIFGVALFGLCWVAARISRRE